jgi:hypothetical protein
MMQAVERRTFTLNAVKVVLSDAPLLPASNDGALVFSVTFLFSSNQKASYPSGLKTPGSDDASTTRLVVKVPGDETYCN